MVCQLSTNTQPEQIVKGQLVNAGAIALLNPDTEEVQIRFMHWCLKFNWDQQCLNGD